MTSIQEMIKPTSQICLSDICQTGKTRIAKITNVKGNPIRIVLAKDCSLRTPWPVSSFDVGGTRCSLDIIMEEELELLAAKIDGDVYAFIESDVARLV